MAKSLYSIQDLKDEIKIIKEKLSGYNLAVKIENANAFLSNRMTEISEKLDFEDELKPGRMYFDLKTFDFHYSYNKENIRLSEMGSGANWLACHLSLFLAILHLNCRENKSSIPSFLFIDQPSQVYFPKVTKIIQDNENDETMEEYDENIIQVKNIFNVIIEEIDNIENDCEFKPQIVVMEHADEKEFDSYVRKRWSTNGEKLI